MDKKFLIMKALIVASLMQLQGCGVVAYAYNHSDPCQASFRQPGYQRPNWCGSGTGNTYYVRDFQTGRVVSTIQPNVYGTPFYGVRPY